MSTLGLLLSLFGGREARGHQQAKQGQVERQKYHLGKWVVIDGESSPVKTTE